MSSIFRPLALLLLSALPAAAADDTRTFSSGNDRVALVELYTSEGCSSCPPADRWLSRLADDAGLWSEFVPVAFHVDYWDYIGWKDEFADPSNTQRQRGYAAAAGARSIYTPQMVVGGRDHVIGYRPMELAMLIEKHDDASPVSDIRAKRDGELSMST